MAWREKGKSQGTFPHGISFASKPAVGSEEKGNVEKGEKG